MNTFSNNPLINSITLQLSKPIRLVSCLVLLLLMVNGCATKTVKIDLSTNTKEYCDRYFVYQMCTKDFTGDGVVDAMYFEDTKDIFMYREEYKKLIEQYHHFHVCAQIMDEKLTKAGSELLTINENTSLLKRSELKSSIFVNYMRYASDINKCNREHGNSNFDAPGEDDFGLPEDDEYSDEY